MIDRLVHSQAAPRCAHLGMVLLPLRFSIFLHPFLPIQEMLFARAP